MHVAMGVVSTIQHCRHACGYTSRDFVVAIRAAKLQFRSDYEQLSTRHEKLITPYCEPMIFGTNGIPHNYIHSWKVIFVYLYI